MGGGYRCIKIQQCVYMEHGVKDIALDVQKHIAPRVVLSLLPAGSRQAAKGARICEFGLLESRLYM